MRLSALAPCAAERTWACPKRSPATSATVCRTSAHTTACSALPARKSNERRPLGHRLAAAAAVTAAGRRSRVIALEERATNASDSSAGSSKPRGASPRSKLDAEGQ